MKTGVKMGIELEQMFENKEREKNRILSLPAERNAGARKSREVT
jgi:hypothetical protein